MTLKIIVKKNKDKKSFSSEVRKFVRQSQLNEFMTTHKLHFAMHVDTKKNDERFLLNSKNERVYKLFDFENDTHYIESQYKKNVLCFDKHFDDFEEEHTKKRT